MGTTGVGVGGDGLSIAEAWVGDGSAVAVGNGANGVGSGGSVQAATSIESRAIAKADFASSGRLSLPVIARQIGFPY